jgi:AraC-like DNA-binding protein
MQYLGRWRMQLAARRLESAGISIAQAGAEVGYESEAAFNRVFKKVVGWPPSTLNGVPTREAIAPEAIA